MTAQAFADLLRARPVGRGRWQARCPAHGDRSPSLQVTEGRDGRVLLKCWAGCPLTSILGAVGLETRDLFSGPPRKPEAIRQAWREREAEDTRERERIAAERKLAGIYRRLGYLVDSLGRRLAWVPEDDVLAGLFHLALAAHQKAGCGFAGAGSFAGAWEVVPFPMRPPIPAALARIALGCPPFDGPDPERQEADRVRTEEQMRRYAHHGWAEPRTTEMPTQKARANGPWKECA